jgi:hypothetical protein
LDKKSAYYLFTFDQQLNVNSIEVIQGFGEEIDQDLNQFFKQDVKWFSGHYTNLSYSIPQTTEYIISVHYNSGYKSISFANIY